MNGEEKERVRTRERGSMEGSAYERALQKRADFHERQLTGRIVVKGKELEWDQGRQGCARHYLSTHSVPDTVLQEWEVFLHDIKSHSGMHRHQGGLVIFVVEGEGYTEIDGEKVDWKAGDLVLLPIKPKGVEHKHYNRDPKKGCRWMAFLYEPMWNHVASEMVQLELHPEFSRKVVEQEKYVQAKAENTTGSRFYQRMDESKLYRELSGAAEGPKVPPGEGFYWDLIRLRDKQRALRKVAKWVVKGDELPWENNPQGIMRWYMHPSREDIVIQTFMFLVQEIPPGSRSGKQRHQGNQVSFIMEGHGHTVIDGVKHFWEAGDLIQLPLRRDGVTFQHFNADGNSRVRLVSCEPNLVHSTGVDRGSGFEQLEVSPDFNREYAPEA